MQPHYFGPKDLLITKEEVERFEKKHKLSIGSRAEVLWTWLKDASNQKALTIIGSAIATVSFALWTLYVHLLS
ncbi:hypothetical protein D3C76_1845960 [compost metagenome]